MAFKFQGFDFLQLDASLTEEELSSAAHGARLCGRKACAHHRKMLSRGTFSAGVVAPMGQLGFYGPAFRLTGCAGMSNVSTACHEELERGDSGCELCQRAKSALVMYPIFTFGSGRAEKTIGSGTPSGEKLGCFGLT